VINLGSGREISVSALATLIAGLTGKPVTIHEDKARVRPEKSEVDRLLSDNSLARELLGWEPKIRLEEGLSRTLEWVRTNLAAYRRAKDSYVI
jgi:dTDP-glucose 4,6-dehydratase